MSSHENIADRLSVTPAENRDSHVGAIDLSVPSEQNRERTLDRDEKSISMISLAKIIQVRTEQLSKLFERGTKSQNVTLAIDYIEESRYWMHDLDAQLDFIRNYREETGSEDVFSESATALINAKKTLKSELDHMLEVTRIWHEDEHGESSPAEIVPEDSEGVFEDVSEDFNDVGLIQDKAPEAETMLASENEQAQVSDAVSAETYLPEGYHVETANDNAIEGAIKPNETLSIHEFGETIQPSMVIDIEQPKQRIELIDIPANLEESNAKYLALNRMARDIDIAIQRKLSYSEREKFDDYLIDLSRQYSAFEERLVKLQRSHKSEATDSEEMQIIADAMKMIEDTRHLIHGMDFNLQTDQEKKLEHHLEFKRIKNEKLSSIADRLTKAIERGGIANPELYMTEQASGLGNIRRSVMSLFGKKENLVNKAMLTKLRNEAIQAERDYLDTTAESNFEKTFPEYRTDKKKSPLLNLSEDADIHDLWLAIHSELEELGSQLEAPLNTQSYEGEGVAKAKKHKYDIDVAPVKEQAREQRSDAVTYRKNELKNIKASGLRNADKLYFAIKNDSQAEHLTFHPADYIGALADLKMANDSKNTTLIETLLPRARSMRDEMDELWMDTTGDEGQPIMDDEAILAKAKILLEEGKRKTKKKK